MRYPKNLQSKFSQLDTLLESLNDLDQNHRIKESDREILSGVIRKADIIVKQLTADKLMPKYDQDIINYLNTCRLIIMEVKADLDRNWGY